MGMPRSTTYDVDGNRRCWTCERFRVPEKFPPSKKNSDGRGSPCYDCRKLRKYGMNFADFEVRMAAQDGVCVICANPCRRNPQLSVDHNHKCCPGKSSCGDCVRGLLCDDCNTGIAKFNDNPERLRKAAEYLETA